MDADTRIIDLTFGQLAEWLREAGFKPVEAKPEPQQNPPSQKGPERWIVKGWDGLAELLGCSKTQARRIAKTGLLRKATYRYGQTVLFDAEKVLEAMRAGR